MTKYFCDLFGEEIHNRWCNYTLPIAGTWIEKEPCDLIPMEFDVCNECKKKIYKTIEKIIPESELRKLNKKALDIRMGLIDE
mgnify:CR=1 FL=1